MRRGPEVVLAEVLGRTGGAADVGRAAADPVTMAMVQQGGRDLGWCSPLVSFVDPRLLVIGGRVSQLVHTLLAEVRGVVHRRSLPLATPDLPVVMSELGAGGHHRGVRLVSDQVVSPR